MAELRRALGSRSDQLVEHPGEQGRVRVDHGGLPGELSRPLRVARERAGDAPDRRVCTGGDPEHPLEALAGELGDRQEGPLQDLPAHERRADGRDEAVVERLVEAPVGPGALLRLPAVRAGLDDRAVEAAGLGGLLEDLDRAPHGPRQKGLVGPGEADDVAGRAAQRADEGVVDAAVGLGDESQVHAARVLAEQREGAVGRAAILDDVLEVRPVLRGDAAEAARQARRVVPADRQDRYARRHAVIRACRASAAPPRGGDPAQASAAPS